MLSYKFIEQCISEYSCKFPPEEQEKLNLEPLNSNTQIIIEAKTVESEFSRAFFIHMNNSIFEGEYLNVDYEIKISDFEKKLESQGSTIFSIYVKDALAYLKDLLLDIQNKVNLLDDELLFSIFSPINSENIDKGFFDDFVNITIHLAYIDHTIVGLDSYKHKLILIRDNILSKNPKDEDLKEVYKKLLSKCSFLLFKMFSSNQGANKYSLDFKVSTIKEVDLIDENNSDFFNDFKCIHKNINEYRSLCGSYQNQFRENKFSSIGFIILSQYYKEVTRDISQINNLITRFEVFYRNQNSKKLTTFEKYSLETIRQYLQNCKFSLKIESKNYSYKQLETDIGEIIKIQEESYIFNYHPFYKALFFLHKILNNNIEHNYKLIQVQEIIILYSYLLEKYKKCLQWSEDRRFYPFQLLPSDCLTQKGIFIASSIAKPINFGDLEEKLSDFKEGKQMGNQLLAYMQNKEDLIRIQDEVKAFRKQSFEYIGIFIAIITFLFGSIQLFGDNQISLKSALINVFSLGIVLSLFAILMCVVSYNFKYEKFRYLTYLVLIALSLLLLYIVPKLF